MPGSVSFVLSLGTSPDSGKPARGKGPEPLASDFRYSSRLNRAAGARACQGQGAPDARRGRRAGRARPLRGGGAARAPPSCRESHRAGAPLERGGSGGIEVLADCHPTLALGRSSKHAFHRASAAIGDAGLVALAPALRRRPALTCLHLSSNLFGDEGLAALVAPPPRAGAPPTTTAGLKKLKLLDLASTQVTDAGCAILTAALKSGALPALKKLLLSGIPASAAAQAAVCDARAALECDWKAYEYDIHGRSSGSPRPRPRHPHGRRRRPLPSLCPLTARAETRPLALPRHGAWQVFEGLPPPLRTQCSAVARHGPGSPFLPSLSSLSSYIITRVAPHCVNTLRILHAAYDATNTTRPLVNTLLSPLSLQRAERESTTCASSSPFLLFFFTYLLTHSPRQQGGGRAEERGSGRRCAASQRCMPSLQPGRERVSPDWAFVYL